MAKHLPDPPGEPDKAARAIIDAIEKYRDDPDRPVVSTAGGLRWIYWMSELAWDESIMRAKESINPETGRKYAFAKIQAATGGALGTLQGRIKAHEHRVAWAALETAARERDIDVEQVKAAYQRHLAQAHYGLRDDAETIHAFTDELLTDPETVLHRYPEDEDTDD